MAEVSQAGNRGRKRMSTRIDFTPMVDLGFLLITFFMLTTAMSTPHVMKVMMPAGEGGKIGKDIAVTVILSGSDRVYYYLGYGRDAAGQLELKETTMAGIRTVLMDKHAAVRAQVSAERDRLIALGFKDAELESRLQQFIEAINTHRDATFVIIKADDRATYENLVDMVDECRVANILRYAIVDITPEELDLIETML